MTQNTWERLILSVEIKSSSFPGVPVTMSTYANKIEKEKNCYKMLSLVMMDTLGEAAHHSNYLELIFIQELGILLSLLNSNSIY